MPLQEKISPENLKLRIADRQKQIPLPDNPDGSFNLDGFRYKPGNYDKYTSWWTFAMDTEKEVRELYFTSYIRNKTFLDIGALCGSWTLPALKAGAEVISIEPDPNFFDILKNNIKLNNFTKWRGINSAIYDRDMVTDFYDMKNVQLERLDSLNLGKIDYIKIDVEGAELEVINGGQNLLLENHPYLFIECHNDVTPSIIRDELFDLVGPIYQCKVIHMVCTTVDTPITPHIFARPI